MNDEQSAKVEEILWGWTTILSNRKHGVRRRPALGGVFGAGGYELASCVMADGLLDCMRYAVMHSESETALSFGATKGEALATARMVLSEIAHARLLSLYARTKPRLEQHRAEQYAIDWQRRRAWRAEHLPDNVVAIEQCKATKKIPRRRQRVFDASGGKCHYCATPLTIDGRWHIEHKMPKALMGGDEPGNLVASCAPCNHKKKDKTDLEFIAERAGVAA